MSYEEYSPSYETATAPEQYAVEPDYHYHQEEPTYSSLPLFDPNEGSYHYSDDYYHEPETHHFTV